MKLFLAYLIFMLFSECSFAIEPGTEPLRKHIGGKESITTIDPGNTGYFRFASLIASSSFNVTSLADACLSTDPFRAIDSGARVQVRRVISSVAETGSMTWGLELDGCHCPVLTPGTYYLMVTTQPTAAFGVVTVTGRDG